jgi:O-antigen ligase
MDGNFLAIFALATYPVFVVALFLLFRPPQATALAFTVSWFLLPPYYALPLSTPTWFGREAIAALSTLIAAAILARPYLRRSRPFRGIELSFVVLVVGAYFTMYTNMDPVARGPVTLQGEKFGDFTSDAIRLIVNVWIAFYLGRVMFKTSRDLAVLYRVLVLAALFYTLPSLYEVRMSPQLQRVFYGYGLAEFGQSVRWGGYRPSVFIGHGLALAMSFFICLVLLLVLARARKRVGPIPTRALCFYLAAVLVLCKSTGAIIYEAIALPLIVFLPPRAWVRTSLILLVIFVAYPMLRFADAIPTKKIGDAFASLSADRAQSLTYRFEMEQAMLDLTRQRPWFGWGGYDRQFMRDLYSGKKLVVPDGWVALQLTTRGLVGFFAYFAPFVVTVARAGRMFKRIQDRSNRMLIAGLIFVCTLILFDLIINSTIPPIFVMLFGALYSLPPALIAEEEEEAEQSALSDDDEWAAVGQP